MNKLLLRIPETIRKEHYIFDEIYVIHFIL